jgi:hypothetical protein
MYVNILRFSCDPNLIEYKATIMNTRDELETLDMFTFFQTISLPIILFKFIIQCTTAFRILSLKLNNYRINISLVT